MRFIDFDKRHILENSVELDNWYEYTIGTPIDVTNLKVQDKNDLLASGLSEDVKEDKFMRRYSPTNKVYFSKKLFESDNEEISVSCYLDDKSRRLYISTSEEYGNKSGVLVFSGYISLNNLVEEDRPVLCTKRAQATIMQRVKVLSIGVKGDMLYGLLYIPSEKGLKVSVRGSNKGISPITYKACSCSAEYSKFTIKDWFDKARIKEK